VSLCDLAFGHMTWPVGHVKDPKFAAQVRDGEVDVIINPHSPFLIGKEVLEAALLRSFNLHPGPLPRYGGLNWVSRAIYRGEKGTRRNLAQAGGMIVQGAAGIGSEERGLSLTAKCVNAGVPLILRLLEVARGLSYVPSIAQDPRQRKYFGREVPDNVSLCWKRRARRTADFVRASNFFPLRSPWSVPPTIRDHSTPQLPKARLTGTPVDALPGTVGTERSGGVEVACADEWILVR
jgi:methionyl-tRNA formyltransferase